MQSMDREREWRAMIHTAEMRNKQTIKIEDANLLKLVRDGCKQQIGRGGLGVWRCCCGASLCILKGRNQDKVVFEGSHLEVGCFANIDSCWQGNHGVAGYPCSAAFQSNDGRWSVHLIRHFQP